MSLEPPPSREVDPLGRAWLKWFSTVREYFNNFALLAGSTTQTFSVGTATAAAHAVRLDQVPPPFRNRIVNGDM